MTAIKNNNKKLSDYVLDYLIKNNIITNNSNLNNLHEHLINVDMANYESGEKYKDTHKHNYTTGINEVQKFLYDLDNDSTWYEMYLELLKYMIK